MTSLSLQGWTSRIADHRAGDDLCWPALGDLETVGLAGPFAGVSPRPRPNLQHSMAARRDRPGMTPGSAPMRSPWPSPHTGRGMGDPASHGPAPGLSLGLIHPRPEPFTGGRGSPVCPGHGRWRLVADSHAQSSKACEGNPRAATRTQGAATAPRRTAPITCAWKDPSAVTQPTMRGCWLGPGQQCCDAPIVWVIEGTRAGNPVVDGRTRAVPWTSATPSSS